MATATVTVLKPSQKVRKTSTACEVETQTLQAKAKGPWFFQVCILSATFWCHPSSQSLAGQFRVF